MSLSCIDLKRDSQLVGNIPIAGKLYIEELHKNGRRREREGKENEDKKEGGKRRPVFCAAAAAKFLYLSSPLYQPGEAFAVGSFQLPATTSDFLHLVEAALLVVLFGVKIVDSFSLSNNPQVFPFSGQKFVVEGGKLGMHFQWLLFCSRFKDF